MQADEDDADEASDTTSLTEIANPTSRLRLPSLQLMCNDDRSPTEGHP